MQSQSAHVDGVVASGKRDSTLVERVRDVYEKCEKLSTFVTMLFFSKYVSRVAMLASKHSGQSSDPKIIAKNIMTLWMIDFGHLIQAIKKVQDEALELVNPALSSKQSAINSDKKKRNVSAYVSPLDDLESMYMALVTNLSRQLNFSKSDFDAFTEKLDKKELCVSNLRRKEQAEDGEKAPELTRSQFILPGSFGQLSGVTLPEEWFKEEYSIDEALLQLVKDENKSGVLDYFAKIDQEGIDEVSQNINTKELGKILALPEVFLDTQNNALSAGSKETNILKMVLSSQVGLMKGCLVSAASILCNGSVSARDLPRVQKPEDGTFYQYDFELLMVSLIAEYAIAVRKKIHVEIMGRDKPKVVVKKDGTKVDLREKEGREYQADINLFQDTFHDLVDIWTKKEKGRNKLEFKKLVQKFHKKAKHMLRLNEDSYVSMSKKMEQALHQFWIEGKALSLSPYAIFNKYHPQFSECVDKEALETRYRVEDGWFHPLFYSVLMATWEGHQHEITTSAYDGQEEVKAMRDGLNHHPSVFLLKYLSRPDILLGGSKRGEFNMLWTKCWKYCRPSSIETPENMREGQEYAVLRLDSARKNVRAFETLYFKAACWHQTSAMRFIAFFGPRIQELEALVKELRGGLQKARAILGGANGVDHEIVSDLTGFGRLLDLQDIRRAFEELLQSSSSGSDPVPASDFNSKQSISFSAIARSGSNFTDDVVQERAETAAGL